MSEIEAGLIGSGLIFLIVLAAGFFVWGVVVLVQEELHDRKIWEEIRRQGLAVAPRANTRRP